MSCKANLQSQTPWSDSSFSVLVLQLTEWHQSHWKQHTDATARTMNYIQFFKFHCLSPLRICPRNQKYTLALSASIYSVKLNVLRPSFIGTLMKCYIAFTLSSSVSNHESKEQQKSKAQRQRQLTGFHLKSLSISAAIFFLIQKNPTETSLRYTFMLLW